MPPAVLSNSHPLQAGPSASPLPGAPLFQSESCPLQHSSTPNNMRGRWAYTTTFSLRESRNTLCTLPEHTRHPQHYHRERQLVSQAAAGARSTSSPLRSQQQPFTHRRSHWNPPACPTLLSAPCEGTAERPASAAKVHSAAGRGPGPPFPQPLPRTTTS